MKNFCEYIKKNPKVLKAIHQGVEKEGLRCDANAYSSMNVHPDALGCKLTHPFITTDYAENLLEFITPVYDNCDEMFEFLRELHCFTYHNLKEEEVIWPWSMPCILPKDESSIAVANYGESNIGKLKSLYRVGLGHRYGKGMQSIAGVHYNFSLDIKFWEKYRELCDDKSTSLQEFINEGYFKLIRNYRRYSWILVYLFGSTPVAHESFLKNKKHDLDKLGKETYGREFATSLRMGGLGYTSKAQEEISICYNHLDTYVKTLELARQKSYSDYEEIGLRNQDGEYQQVNTNLLQIDNEFYSTIRPKRTAGSRESALQALHRGGVEYIEVRLMDIDLFTDTGLSKPTVKFLHTFLMGCLLMDSPIIGDAECLDIDKNLNIVVNEGRKPGVTLACQAGPKPLTQCADDLLTSLDFVATLLDQAYATNMYTETLELQKKKVYDTELLPSAKIVSMVSDEKSILDVVRQFASDYKSQHLAVKLCSDKEKKWEELARESFQEETKIRATDLLNFEDFLEEYFKNIKIKFKE